MMKIHVSFGEQHVDIGAVSEGYVEARTLGERQRAPTFFDRAMKHIRLTQARQILVVPRCPSYFAEVVL